MQGLAMIHVAVAIAPAGQTQDATGTAHDPTDGTADHATDDAADRTGRPLAACRADLGPADDPLRVGRDR